MLDAVLWMQTAAEYTANLQQAYALARADLDRALDNPASWPDAVTPANPTSRARLAVIVDADETILDNSPQDAGQIVAGRRTYDPAAWDRWEREGKPAALPGALELLRYAAARGVTVFYVTNRSLEAPLRARLKELGFPIADTCDPVRMVGECSMGDASSDKECRRQDIARDYRVLLLLGDDLGDFMSVKGMGVAERRSRVQAAKDRWGHEWIVLPNPAYGSWERALWSKGDDDCTILRKKRSALEEK
jgi:acid phosphatase